MAKEVLTRCQRLHLRLTTAESCTGGLIAACLTSIPGSSEVFDRGFVTYDNAAKSELLGVPERSLIEFGAVSKCVACEMAQGALANSAAQVAVSTTGIAGPGGGTKTKPVGIVHIAVAGLGNEPNHERKLIKGSREVVRLLAMEESLIMVSRHIKKYTD